VKTGEEAMNVRKGATITTKRNLPVGIGFTRYAMALAVSKGSTMQAAEFAKKWEQDTPEVSSVLKAAVAAGTTTDPTWAEPLVDYQNLASEFIEYLRPKTILGNISGLRNVSFNVQMAGQTSGGSAGWVGEGAPKPVTKLDFNRVQLGMAKLAAIVVETEELMRSSNPSSEAIIRDSLRDAIVERIDIDLLDPTKAAVAGVSPSSITNGAATIVASGTDMDALKADVEKQFEALITAGAGQITLLKADEIFLADDGQVMIDVSGEATVEMEDSPTGDTTKFVSLWQNNLVGVRAERFINWQLRRAGAVHYITGAAYR